MKFKQTMGKLRAIAFIKKNEKEFQKGAQPFLELYNKAGKEPNGGDIQVSVLSSYLTTICRSTNQPNASIVFILEEITKTFKAKK